jgi:amino acid adenylation domain-containing protein
MRLALMRVSENAYYWLWSHHHALLDGWSSPLVLGEVFTCYQAFSRGLEPQLPLGRPYREFISWLQRQDLARAESYWREALNGFDTPTPLRLERPPSSGLEPERDYAVQHLRLSEETTRGLQMLAQQERLTLHTLVQGSWAILLSRYSGTTDVVFGTTVSGRSPEIAGVDTMIGLFINTLPSRVRIPAGKQLLSWLGRLQAQQAEARQYEYTPLLDIQTWSNVPRGTPLFETIFVFENYPMDRALSEGRKSVQRAGLEIFDFHTYERTNYPLTAIVRLGRQLELRLAYETKRFDEVAIRRLLGHWRILLEGMSADPGRPLGTLPLLTEAEQHTMLVEWNRTAADTQSAGCVHDLFTAQAARCANAIAVITGDQGLNYRQLDHWANGLAHYLRRAGVGPEVCVGICLERSTELLVAILGVLKAGGAYVPLDPSYPKERLALLLRDCQAPVLLTRSPLRDRLPNYAGKVLDLDCDEIAPANSSPAVAVFPDNLAYVIYTSGSTGQPKGVMMTHRCLCNLLSWQLREPTFSPSRRSLQFASASFDVCFQEMFSTWLSGGTLVLIDEDVRRDSTGLLRFLNEQGIERLFLPFVALRHLAEAAEAPAQSEKPGLDALREVITAGEQLQITPALASWFGRLGGCTLQNQYGPSESHVVTAFMLEGCAEGWPALPPIGRPIANGRIYVLDSQLRPVPIGVPGELCIGGISIGRGYLDRPDFTAEKFVPDPFSDQPGARVYKTGDVARFLPDGNLEFLGREDGQVKIRGFRVEPGEVETALRRHLAVKDCAVLAQEDESRIRRLIAYVVASKEADATATELRRYLSDKLPEYLVPGIYVFLDALPLTASGKLDRRALQALTMARTACRESSVIPDGPLEQILAGIWSEVLKINPVGRHDNFFELGGDSLLSLQVLSRIRATFEVDLPLRILFDSPTVASLAEALRRLTDTADRVAETALSLAELSDAEVEALLAARSS